MGWRLAGAGVKGRGDGRVGVADGAGGEAAHRVDAHLL